MDLEGGVATGKYYGKYTQREIAAFDDDYDDEDDDEDDELQDHDMLA